MKAKPGVYTNKYLLGLITEHHLGTSKITLNSLRNWGGDALVERYLALYSLEQDYKKQAQEAREFYIKYTFNSELERFVQ